MINEIKNTTVYNKDLIIKYNQYYSKNFILKNFIIIGMITVGFSIYMFIQREYMYTLLLFAILIVYYLLTLLLQKFTVKRMLRRSPLVENPITQTYVFTETDILVTNPKQNYRVKNDDIQSVKETKAFFLIKTTNKQSLIIDKNGFHSQQDTKDLRAYFVVRFNMKD
jgi:hypothetical protein